MRRITLAASLIVVAFLTMDARAVVVLENSALSTFTGPGGLGPGDNFWNLTPTLTGNPNSYLLVALHTNARAGDNTEIDPAGVTYNNAPLTLLDFAQPANPDVDPEVFLFGLANPGNVGDLVVQWPKKIDGFVSYLELSGVDQLNPVNDTDTDLQQSATTSTVSLNGLADGYLAGFIASVNFVGPSVYTNADILHENNNFANAAAGVLGRSLLADGPADSTFLWPNSRQMAHVGVTLNPHVDQQQLPDAPAVPEPATLGLALLAGAGLLARRR